MEVAINQYVIHGLKYLSIKLFLEKLLKDIKAYLLYVKSNNLASFLLLSSTEFL